MDDFEYDVFMSHTYADKPRVRRIAQGLKGAGLQVWFDEWGINPGDDILLCIEHALDASRCLVLCMSKKAFGSDWVNLERSTVLFRDPSNKTRRFIPLLLENCTIPAAIGRFAYVDGRKGTNQAIKELLKVCQPQFAATPPASHQSEGKLLVRWHLELDMNVGDLGPESLGRILARLRTISGDPKLVLKDSRQGSVILSLEGSLHGYRKIQALLTAGLLPKELGVRVIRVGRGLSSEACMTVVASNVPTWSPTVAELLSQLRALLVEERLVEALELGRVLCRRYPKDWRFSVYLSTVLVRLKAFDEANALLDAIVVAFSDNPRAISYAYQNKAYLTSLGGGEEQRSAEEQLRLYQLSLGYEPRPSAYVGAVSCLLKLGRIVDAEAMLSNALMREGFLRYLKTVGYRAFDTNALKKSKLLDLLVSDHLGDQ
jgi:hypothetical protein